MTVSESLENPVLAAGPVVIVRLLELPVPLFAVSQQHSDELVREFQLMAGDTSSSDEGTGHRSRPVPARLVALVEAFGNSYGAFTGEAEARLADAVRRGESVLSELVYEIPASAAAAAEQLGRMLDEADDFCREGEYLLTLATPADQVQFRRWYLSEFVRQIGGEAPTSWPEYAGARDS